MYDEAFPSFPIEVRPIHTVLSKERVRVEKHTLGKELPPPEAPKLLGPRGKGLPPLRYEAPEHTTVRKVERGSDRTNACFLPRRSEGTVPFPSHSWAYGTHVVTRREGKVHFLCACRGALVRKDFVPSREQGLSPRPERTVVPRKESDAKEGNGPSKPTTVPSREEYHRNAGKERHASGSGNPPSIPVRKGRMPLSSTERFGLELLRNLLRSVGKLVLRTCGVLRCPRWAYRTKVVRSDRDVTDRSSLREERGRSRTYGTTAYVPREEIPYSLPRSLCVSSPGGLRYDPIHILSSVEGVVLPWSDDTTFGVRYGRDFVPIWEQPLRPWNLVREAQSQESRTENERRRRHEEVQPRERGTRKRDATSQTMVEAQAPRSRKRQGHDRSTHPDPTLPTTYEAPFRSRHRREAPSRRKAVTIEASHTDPEYLRSSIP